MNDDDEPVHLTPLFQRKCNHRDGLYHDCQYVNARNALLREAVQITDRLMGGAKSLTQDRIANATYNAKWTKEFIGVMDRLWAERGT